MNNVDRLLPDIVIKVSPGKEIPHFRGKIKHHSFSLRVRMQKPDHC